MTKKMLIDATHAEETRVAVVLDDNRLDDFDFENTVRKTLKGNIYLVKVTRVEPSLQAAFVDYGGNRHGFLPFPEIHPDYYRIPIADRQALIAEQQPDDVVESEDDDDDDDTAKGKKRKSKKDDDDVEFVGGEEDVDDTPTFKRTNIKHRYKIQEVIKRNQIMLIQVNKEERGNKGAAVSSYISLPGRYCVLMPNSPRAGGVSRKVSNTQDRSRLKKILAELNVPEGMSVIVRTAGISRTKAEIKRDFEYLMRLWDKIRDLTLKSTAPELVHEEGDLIKRAIRDLYRRDIDEIVVEGEKGYKRARDFMKMLMPSHVRRISQYKNENGVPLFFKHHVEKQIDEIYSIEVRLKSGGYIVINPTEALISVDVNSGKATKGRHIEETAVRTNVEAAEELARQLRLRDLGGLVVIDFIDMEDYKNNRIVERHLKDAMQRDRARIQFGRISAFGLLELSRQRMRPSLVETNFELCKYCHGVGVVRTVETSAAVALRAIEEEGLHGRADEIKVFLTPDVALYIFNNKRDMLSEIEKRYEMRITLEADAALIKPEYRVDLIKERSKAVPLIDMSTPVFKKTETSPVHSGNGDSDDDDGNRKGRRRRSRRGGSRRNRRGNVGDQANAAKDGDNKTNDQSADKSSDVKKDAADPDTETKADQKADKKETAAEAEKKSSRGKKTSRGGGRKNKADKGEASTGESPVAASIQIVPDSEQSNSGQPDSGKKEKMPEKSSAASEKEESPKKRGRKATATKTASKSKETASDVVKMEDRPKNKTKAPEEDNTAPSNDSKKSKTRSSKPAKKGWWQRLTDG